MGTPLHIALRYLFAKKKHNVINIISIISAAGIAIGSMALVLILSVYNGFDNSIREIYEGFKADFTITPPEGKTIETPPQTLGLISSTEGVVYVCTVVSDNIFVRYGKKEAIATIIGTDTAYFKWNGIAANLVEGTARLRNGEIREALIGEDLARRLEARVRFLTPVELYYPQKGEEFSITNPLASINGAKVFPSAILRDSGYEIENAIYTESSLARELIGVQKNEYSYLEVYTAPGTDKDKIREALHSILPDSIIRDKQQQNSTLYKMMKAEKFAVYMILFFVIAIISINIFSCLSMMVTEKEDDISTFLSMGATKETIMRIFHLHGFLICVTGCCTGTIIGLAAAFLQKEYGIISLPGNYIVSAYPVDIQFADIAIIVIGVCLTGYLISWLPSGKIFKN